MNKQDAIYTESNNCQDCYKCIRHCPVKAIKIEQHSASIIHDLCIYCGICTTICPSEAKKIRNDEQTVRFFLEQDEPVYLSLAPSYISNFTNWKPQQLLNAITSLGFAGISETALGAEYLSAKLREWLPGQPKNVYISSCCPSVVELIQKYYPQHIDKLTPFVSPAQSHARILKNIYPKSKVVFAGPCIAKKTEQNFPGNKMDAVITFQELNNMLDCHKLTPETDLPDDSVGFIPHEAKTGRLYPVDGGMSNSINPGVGQTSSVFMSFSGISSVKEVLDNLPEKPDQTIFLELLACDGGCINGPGGNSRSQIIQSRQTVLSSTNEPGEMQHATLRKQNIDIHTDYNFNILDIAEKISNEDIEETLASIGKVTTADELNCGGCGYSTCKAFATAILEGKAERQMCVSYMRKMAQNKASVLLRKMPYGVVIVDDELKVIESNQLFASIWGKSSRKAYEEQPGLEGKLIDQFTPLTRLFKNLLESGHDRIEKDLEYKNIRLHVSLFTIQKHKQVCAIVRIPGKHEISVQDQVERLKQVIRENMRTAQRAASLIGENAASSECAINSVIDTLKGDQDE